MDTGIITPTGVEEKMPLFQIGPYLVGVVRNAIKDDMILNAKYQYMRQCITRFSPEVILALTDLNYKIVAPFAKSVNNVLFSNGGALFMASKNYVCGRYFKPEQLPDSDGYPIPTDEMIKYDKELANIDNIQCGIIDNNGYVDSTFLDPVTKVDPGRTSNVLLASLLLMNDMLFYEPLYKDALKNRKKMNDLEYMTSKPNCICIQRDGDKFNLSYVSDNLGKVGNFIQKLKDQQLIAKYDMLPAPSTDLTVQEEGNLQVVEEKPTGLMAK